MQSSVFTTQGVNASNDTLALGSEGNCVQKSTPGLKCYNLVDDIPFFTNYPLDKAADARSDLQEYFGNYLSRARCSLIIT